MQRLLALPTLHGWLTSLLIFGLFCAISIPFGMGTGLLAWRPDADGIIVVALIALVLPSILEELVFRAPLLWAPEDREFTWGTALLTAFVFWHPLNAWLFLPQARVLFDDPRFLIIAAGLGLTASMTTVMTRSILPGVLIHWLTVLGWKGLFGGEQYLAI